MEQGQRSKFGKKINPEAESSKQMERLESFVQGSSVFAD